MEKYQKQLFILQADICKTLSDANRLMILHELQDGEKSVSELIKSLKLPQSTVSRHLAVLRERDIVLTRREKTTVFYRLADPKIGEACNMVRQVLQVQLRRNQNIARNMNRNMEVGETE